MPDLNDPRKTAVVWIGNVLSGDDGIAEAVYWEMKEHAPLPASVKQVAGRTGSIDIVMQIEHCSRAIFVDAVSGIGKPGTVRKLTLSELRSVAEKGLRSAHDANYLYAIEHALALGHPMPEIIVIGIEPKRTDAEVVRIIRNASGDCHLLPELSPEVEAAIPAVIRMIRDEIEKNIP